MLKPIPGYENYSASDEGVVVNTSTGAVKKPTLNKANGYLYVDLYRDNKRAKRPVHRLVAELFVPNEDGKPTVDHADGNRQNNKASNLRWATFSEQNSRFETSGVRSDPVLVLHYGEKRKKRGGGHEAWLDVDSVMRFDSIAKTAQHFECTTANISLMLKSGEIGRRGKMRGFKFEYADGKRKCHRNV